MLSVTETSLGLCQCGCGQRTNPAPCNNRSKGWVKGEPLRFVAGHQSRPGNRYRAPHATNGKYAAGCRCEPCTWAHREYRRLQQERLGRRTKDGTAVRELLGCMVGFGVEEARIADLLGIEGGRVRLLGDRVRASTARELARLHWGAWRASAEFRRDCRCPVPREVLESLERAS